MFQTLNNVVVSVVSIVVVAGSLYLLFRPETEEPKKVPKEGGLGLSREERELFIPTVDWQKVEDHHVCPPGLEYRLNMSDGSKLARLPG
jgi:hypothetical protein